MRDEYLLKLFSEENKPFALDELIVAEISGENFAGAIASSLLAELGAKVYRIEFEDDAKKISPFGVQIDGIGIPYFIETRNKEILKFDEKAKEIVQKADVVIDAMQPGFLDSIGIGYRQISEKNPRVIYAAISPYGHFTSKAEEFRNVPDSDLTAQAYNGYPTLIGNPFLTGKHSYPLRAGIWAAWIMAGANAAVAIMIALIERGKSRKGQFIDVATHDAIATITAFPYIVGFLFGKPRGRFGTIDYILYPFGYHKTKDGYVVIATPTDADFRALLKILGRWDLEPDWKFTLDRITDDVERIKILDDELNKTIQNFKTYDLIKRARKTRKIPILGKILGRFLGEPVIVKINTLQEVLKDEHWWIRKSFIKVKIDGKNVLIPNVAFKMSETPPRVLKVLKGQL
ncbi:MAG: CoA transferase [Archaeoglobaceae archaeon]|nr:CoA transferase [Archaeoglobaceae archaeon]